MAWHLGYPLSQTLFTSVYVESLLMPTPKSLEEARFVRESTDDPNRQPMLAVLRAYCVGMLKACGHVNDRIRSEHFYEVGESKSIGATLLTNSKEEDFVTNTYNRHLLANIETAEIQQAIAEARNRLDSLKTVDDEIKMALDRRLELRRHFLDATECAEHMDDLELARKPWKDALTILQEIKSTHPLGKAVDAAFSTKLQRKLASTMPPRPIVKLSFEDAFGHLSRLFKDGSELIDVLRYKDSQCLQVGSHAIRKGKS